MCSRPSAIACIEFCTIYLEHVLLVSSSTDSRRNQISQRRGHQSATIITQSTAGLQAPKLRDLERPSTCLPNEYTGSKDNDSIPERAISFDCTVITCSEKGKPAWLFTYKVKDWGHQGESPPKPKGRETGKEWLEYFVDSLSLEIFTNGLRNPLSEMRQHSCFILRAWEELRYLLFSYSCYLDFVIFLECF